MNFAEYVKKITSLNPAREVFVAVLDVLGFSDFVRRNSHEKVVRTHQALTRHLLDMTLSEIAELPLESSPWLQAIASEGGDGDYAPKLDNVTFNCLTASDSITLFSTGSELKDLMALLALVRNFMARTLYFGFPLRGAIAHGTATFDFDIPVAGLNIIHHQMLGLPIVEAASLEKKQQWSGCAIHKSVTAKLGPIIKRLDPLMVTQYEVPILQKNKHSKQYELVKELMLVVNWVQGIADADKSKIDSNKIRSAFADHGKEINDEVEEKIANTTKFFEDMSSHPVYKNEMSNAEW